MRSILLALLALSGCSSTPPRPNLACATLPTQGDLAAAADAGTAYLAGCLPAAPQAWARYVDPNPLDPRTR